MHHTRRSGLYLVWIQRNRLPFLILCILLCGMMMAVLGGGYTHEDQRAGTVCSLGKKTQCGFGCGKHTPVRHARMAWLNWHGFVFASSQCTAFPYVCEDFLLFALPIQSNCDSDQHSSAGSTEQASASSRSLCRHRWYFSSKSKTF